jgi:hypothetical protein
MSARQQSNVHHLLIGGTANITTGGVSSLNAGEIGIFNAGGVRLTEGSASKGQDFFLAVGGTSPLVRTPLLKGSAVKSAAWAQYSAATTQVDYIGFNGASGSIETIDNNLYMTQVYMEELLTSSTDGRYIKHFQYESDSSATQAEVANGLFKSAVFNFKREPKNASGDAPLVFEMMMAAGSDVALGTSVDDVVFVKGSATISATDIDDATGNPALAVGDYLRVGTAATDEVYKIIAIDATNNTATLDVPYQGASQTLADTALKVIPAASAASVACGVKLSAAAKDHVVGKEHYGVIRYNFNLKDAGSTTITNSAAAAEGVGEVNALKDLEWFTKGNQGEYFRMGEPTIYSYSSDVDESVAGSGYDILSLKLESADLVGFQNNVSPIEVSLATPATAPNYILTATSDDITDVLEVIIYGAPANGALANS